MKTTRPKQLEDALNYMKSKVQDNLNIIKTCNDEANLIRSTEVFSEIRNNKLKEIEKYSKTLFNENQDLIKIQNAIISYLSIHNPVRAEEKNKSLPKTDDEIYDLTINDKMKIDSLHPFYNNSKMLKKMLKHFEITEQYEKCAEISEIINKIEEAVSHNASQIINPNRESIINRLF